LEVVATGVEVATIPAGVVGGQVRAIHRIRCCSTRLDMGRRATAELFIGFNLLCFTAAVREHQECRQHEQGQRPRRSAATRARQPNPVCGRQPHVQSAQCTALKLRPHQKPQACRRARPNALAHPGSRSASRAATTEARDELGLGPRPIESVSRRARWCSRSCAEQPRDNIPTMVIARSRIRSTRWERG